MAARIFLPADAETDPVPAIIEYNPYRKRDLTAHQQRAVPRLPRRSRLRGRAPRDPGLGRVRRDPRRRVPAAGAERRRRGDRLARPPAVVLREGRHDRQLVGRVQRPPGRRAPAARARGDRHLVLDRRSLRRRHALHGRLPAHRHARLGRDVPGAPGPAARSGAGRRGLARDVAAPDGRGLRAGGGVAPPPAA